MSKIQKKALNQVVMTKAYRLGLTSVYESVLGQFGISFEVVQVHLDSSATVSISENELETLRANGDTIGLIELSVYRNSGTINIHISEGLKYLSENRPTLTDEQRAAKTSKSDNSAAKKAAETRKANKAALLAQLKAIHGISLESDSDDESEDDEDEG